MRLAAGCSCSHQASCIGLALCPTRPGGHAATFPELPGWNAATLVLCAELDRLLASLWLRSSPVSDAAYSRECRCNLVEPLDSRHPQALIAGQAGVYVQADGCYGPHKEQGRGVTPPERDCRGLHPDCLHTELCWSLQQLEWPSQQRLSGVLRACPSLSQRWPG